MLYGEQLRVFDATNFNSRRATPIELEAALGEVGATPPLLVPAKAFYFGYLVTETFNYDTQVHEGVLTLYKYPGGDASKKVALSPTIKLKDGRVAGMTYYVYVSDVPADVAPATFPDADCNVGDVLAVEITTQGSGGGYLEGAFQPFIIAQDRGENLANQANLVDCTATG